MHADARAMNVTAPRGCALWSLRASKTITGTTGATGGLMKRSFIAGLIIGALSAGAVAYASIPDGSGVIHACRNKGAGQVRIVDTPSQRCRPDEIALTWNQSGPPGPKGDPGSPGGSGQATFKESSVQSVDYDTWVNNGQAPGGQVLFTIPGFGYFYDVVCGMTDGNFVAVRFGFHNASGATLTLLPASPAGNGNPAQTLLPDQDWSITSPPVPTVMAFNDGTTSHVATFTFWSFPDRGAGVCRFTGEATTHSS